MKGADAGIADEHIHPAEGYERRFDKGGRAFGLGDVTLHGQAAPSRGGDRRDRLGGIVVGGVEIVDRHVGALARGFDRHGAADASRGAGDEQHFILQKHLPTLFLWRYAILKAK